MTWVEVPRSALHWLAGEPRSYRHESDWIATVTRRFCGSCGTSLTYERDGSDYLDVAVGSMDDPEIVAPHHHVYERRISWFDTVDDLPRYERGRPGSR